VAGRSAQTTHDEMVTLLILGDLAEKPGSEQR